MEYTSANLVLCALYGGQPLPAGSWSSTSCSARKANSMGRCTFVRYIPWFMHRLTVLQPPMSANFHSQICLCVWHRFSSESRSGSASYPLHTVFTRRRTVLLRLHRSPPASSPSSRTGRSPSVSNHVNIEATEFDSTSR